MRIRRIESRDLPLRVEWMNNPKIYSSMHFAIPVSLENTQRWYESNRNSAHRADLVFESDAGDVVAMGGLTSIDSYRRCAELYIFVNPERKSQGIGRKSTCLLCKYGFDVLKLHKIYLVTNKSNLAAQKVYESVGFKLEGILRDELVEGESYSDRLYYGLLSSEFDGTDIDVRF